MQDRSQTSIYHLDGQAIAKIINYLDVISLNRIEMTVSPSSNPFQKPFELVNTKKSSRMLLR